IYIHKTVEIDLQTIAFFYQLYWLTNQLNWLILMVHKENGMGNEKLFQDTADALLFRNISMTAAEVEAFCLGGEDLDEVTADDLAREICDYCNATPSTKSNRRMI
ncbi:MAG: hypothetical protein WC261_14075, partial [Synergistaceae bacterium]